MEDINNLDTIHNNLLQLHLLLLQLQVYSLLTVLWDHLQHHLLHLLDLINLLLQVKLMMLLLLRNHLLTCTSLLHHLLEVSHQSGHLLHLLLHLPGKLLRKVQSSTQPQDHQHQNHPNLHNQWLFLLLN